MGTRLPALFAPRLTEHGTRPTPAHSAAPQCSRQLPPAPQPPPPQQQQLQQQQQQEQPRLLGLVQMLAQRAPSGALLPPAVALEAPLQLTTAPLGILRACTSH